MFGLRKRRNPRGRGIMHFLGVRRSARDASHYFSRLRQMVDGGKGLKQGTIESKIRAAYKRGINQSLLVRHEAKFDGERELKGKGKGVVKHFLLENPDRTMSLTEYLQEIATEVIRLMDEHQDTKVRLGLKLHLMDPRGEKRDLTPKGLNSLQNMTRQPGENSEIYFGTMVRRYLKALKR